MRRGVNTLHLSGWAQVTSAKEIRLNGRLQLSLRGVVVPDPERTRVSYPIIATGTPAQILLDWARKRDEPPQVVINGRLLNLEKTTDSERDYAILVKYLDILDVEPDKPHD